MGGIDLDPASCAAANQIVGAGLYYDSEGETLPWFGRVFCNPPYNSKVVRKFAARAVRHPEVTFLCNNATETVAGQMLLERAGAVCFLDGRVRFLDASLQPAKTPLQGQMVCYWGPSVEMFKLAFDNLGSVLKR